MITHEALFEACKKYGLDPMILGESKRMNSRPLSSYNEPIDLKTIGFPKEELEQVTEIGKIVYNLTSQLSGRHLFNLGKEEDLALREKDKAINSIISTSGVALDFWLTSGLKKSKKWKDLIIYKGRIFEMNPGYQKSMEEMNKRLAEYHREFIIKQAKSERGAENIILR